MQSKTIRCTWPAVGMLKITSVVLFYHADYLDFLPGLSCYGLCLIIRAQLLTPFLKIQQFASSNGPRDCTSDLDLSTEYYDKTWVYS
jgi:hypothetical protein